MIVLIYAIAGMLVGGLALGILGTLWGVLNDKYMEWKTGEPYSPDSLSSYLGFISGLAGAIAGLIVGAILGFIA